MWREIGPVLQDKKDEIWERFRNATEKINERRREYYDKLKEDQENNLETKTALCEKAEQIAEMVLTTVKEWQEQTNVLDDMLKTWKTLARCKRSRMMNYGNALKQPLIISSIIRRIFW